MSSSSSCSTGSFTDMLSETREVRCRAFQLLVTKHARSMPVQRLHRTAERGDELPPTGTASLIASLQVRRPTISPLRARRMPMLRPMLRCNRRPIPTVGLGHMREWDRRAERVSTTPESYRGLLRCRGSGSSVPGKRDRRHSSETPTCLRMAECGNAGETATRALPRRKTRMTRFMLTH